jgi:predicted DNA-binding transcriptional regulator YafY
MRFSFCCATEGCRRRLTPASLRFLGRKVFFGVLVLLVPVLRDGATPERLGRLCERFTVSARTVRRWMRFWRETFVTSRVWQSWKGHFALPVRADAMPMSLLEAFSGITDTASRLVAVLRLVAPVGP